MKKEVLVDVSKEESEGIVSLRSKMIKFKSIFEDKNEIKDEVMDAPKTFSLFENVSENLKKYWKKATTHFEAIVPSCKYSDAKSETMNSASKIHSLGLML
uniref:Uncharacterized protein n=1 Tax=Polytomella parva TaxID=51329 RepID=A0A7S0VAD4_9CHLO